MPKTQRPPDKPLMHQNPVRAYWEKPSTPRIVGVIAQSVSPSWIAAAGFDQL
jgi:hypothetical protein